MIRLSHSRLLSVNKLIACRVAAKLIRSTMITFQLTSDKINAFRREKNDEFIICVHFGLARRIWKGFHRSFTR